MYGKFIQNCRELFGCPPRRFSTDEVRDLVAPEPAWLSFDGRREMHDLFEAGPAVFSQGDVRWGAVAHAHRICWEESPIDASACIVHSPDHHFDDNPDELLAIGHELYSEKSKDPHHPKLRKFADSLRDEEDVHIRMRVPESLSSHRVVDCTTSFVVRQHLPLPYLAVSLVPIVAHRNTGQCWILPARWWASGLIAKWIASISSLRSERRVTPY